MAHRSATTIGFRSSVTMARGALTALVVTVAMAGAACNGSHQGHGEGEGDGIDASLTTDKPLSSNMVATIVAPFVAEPSIHATVTRTDRALSVGFAQKTTATVELPLRGDQAFTVRTDRAAIAVRLLGAAPVPAQVAGSLVTYAGVLPHVDSIHVPSPEGTEEWLRIAAPMAESKLEYALQLDDAAGLRLIGDVLEVLDAHGDPRLRTVAPTGTDAQGRRLHGSLSIEGCAFDTSPAVPWNRPVTPPGSTHCTVIARFEGEGLAYPLLIDPAWTTTGGLATKRVDFAAATTSFSGGGGCIAGCVLVAGGATPGPTGTVLSSAEVYNVGTKTWGATGNLPGVARRGVAGADSGNGVIVVAGGLDSAGIASKQTAYWSPAGFVALPDLSYAVGGAGMTTLTNFGAVMVGGSDDFSSAIANTALFSRSTLAWTVGQPMATARTSPLVGSAGTGGGGAGVQYRVCAGSYGSATISCVAYKTAFESQPWGNVGGVGTARSAVATMPNGTMILQGGSTTVDVISVGLYGTICIPSCTMITSPASIAVNSIAGAVGAAVGTDRVIFAGGSNVGIPSPSSVVSIVQPGVPRASTDHMANTRFGHRAVSLPDGSAFVIGGQSLGFATGPANEEIFAIVPAAGTCTSNAECTGTLSCADGVCCNVACTGICEACNLPGSVGTCAAVSADPKPGHGACSSPAGGLCGFQCNGSDHGACHATGTGTSCNPETCGATGYTPAYTCDGAGTCAAPVGSYPLSCKQYVCKGTKCGTSCTTNPDCATGYKCDTASSTCIPAGGGGSACGTTTDCLPGLGLTCVDSVCCSTSACASPLKCNVPGAEGSCKLPLSSACTAATAAQCGSGFCTDGVCCDATCTGQCEQCALPGYKGHCTPTPSSSAPVGGRTACGGSGACQSTCDGTTRGACGAFPPASKVCTAASCSAGKSTDISYCNGLGVCVAGATLACGGYVCGPSACLPTCSVAGDCATGYFCDTGVCKTTGANGTTCSTKSECASGNCVDGVCCTTASCGAGLVCNASGKGTCSQPNGSTCAAGTVCGSGFCVDGVCCDSACNGQCEACDVGGRVGSCGAVAGSPHGARTTCTGSGVCQSVCDGTDTTKCGALPGVSTACASGKCTGTSRTDISYCDGLGGCVTPSATTCLPFTCDATTCRASCTPATSLTDCGSGYACTGGVCKTEGDLGTVCDDSVECKSKFCVDSTATGKKVCCDVASCDGGTFCGTTDDKTPGSCIKKNGNTCGDSTECASGICVDGVCCDTACGGQCEACNVVGALGKCSAVTGAPQKPRTACSDGGGDVCKALACDGSKDRTKCSSFANGLDKECARSCTDGTLSTATCDGAGSCAAPKTTACAGFACSGKDCKTTCASEGDCTSGFSCNATSGKCEPIKSSCTDDLLQSVPADGKPPTPCEPYLCQKATGACYPSCTSTDQCFAGYSCDGEHCVAAAPPDTGSGGGCTIATLGASGEGASGDGTTWMMLLSGIAFAVGIVKRRSARASD